MPLKAGSNRKVVGSNIKELVDTYKAKGRIGTSKPASKKAAVKQAVAISLKRAGMDKTKASIRKRGGTITYKRDGKLPVGVY